MAFKFVLFAACVAVASASVIPAPVAYATHAAPVAYATHAAPVAYAAHPAPVAYAAAAPVAYAKLDEYDPNPQYSYSYGVEDALTGDSKSQHETRSGDVVQGQYSLDDPDGTRRTVDYTADPINGFNAVVRKDPQVKAFHTVAAAPVVAAPAPVIAEAGPAVIAARVAAPVAYAAAPAVAHYAAAPVAHYAAAPVAHYAAAPVAHYATAPASVSSYSTQTVSHTPVTQYAAAPVAHYAAAPVAHYAAAPVAYAAAPAIRTVAHVAPSTYSAWNYGTTNYGYAAPALAYSAKYVH